ncbi:hypothetical protein [Microbacterium indicum]|uniref:hypothetical protein n=1 Tax=Microbacterium indicum TaxID=358100 RepID=UPI000425DA99|nr:hypothetical protein [Microbacterium indicum]
MAGIDEERQGADARAAGSQAGTVRVRRVPKYGVFTAIGVVLGIVAAMILATAFDGTSEPSPYTEVSYSKMQAFGFIALWCIPAGIAIMLVVAMILDRIVSRKARELEVTFEIIEERREDAS